MSIEATPRELAETLVTFTPPPIGSKGEVHVFGVYVGMRYRPNVTAIREGLERLIEDERRRADEMVRRAVENCRAGVGT